MNPKILWNLFNRYKGDRFFDEVFDKEIYKAIWDLGRIKTVIDLGALHGEFGFYIYDHAEEIYCVEPHPEAYKQLVENCKDLPKIKTFNLVISNTNGTKYIRGGDDGGATTQNEDGDNCYRVPCMTLATFMKENNIDEVDALKIDIESHEPAVFGSSDFKDVANKIKLIQGEHGAGLQAVLEPLGFLWEDGFVAKRMRKALYKPTRN